MGKNVNQHLLFGACGGQTRCVDEHEDQEFSYVTSGKSECQCIMSMSVFTKSFDGLPQSDNVIFGIKAGLWLDGSSFSILKSDTTFSENSFLKMRL